MCLQSSAVRPYQQWRWSGDEIVHSPVIPAARRPAGSRQRGYDIDIREYLSIQSNTVVSTCLHAFLNTLPASEQLRFLHRSEGSFDFRADMVVRSMAKLRYIRSRRNFDQWLFPDETLSLGGGDCEDLAFLLAALLGASGISPECIRLALGKIIDHSDPENPRSWSHAWVMYQRENSAWQILEPLAKIHRPASARGARGARGAHGRGGAAGSRSAGAGSVALQDVEYRPHFVFNQNHLWRVRSPSLEAAEPFADYLSERADDYWRGFDPSFAAGVHNDIFDHALTGMTWAELQIVKSASLGVDANVLGYDPRDHFDFAYIAEGWQRVRARLATGELRDFGLATHAIADFYAHSLYGWFARDKLVQGKLPIYDPDQPLPPGELDYGFLQNEKRPEGGDDAAQFAERWRGKLISGQWWRWYTTYPSDLRADVPARRCLPDHDRLAVDSPNLGSGGNALFADAPAYGRQFQLRRQAAIDHIAAEYKRWKPAQPPVESA